MAYFPEVVVDLSDTRGNPYLLLKRVQKAMRAQGLSHHWPKYKREVGIGTYAHALEVTKAWFTCTL